MRPKAAIRTSGWMALMVVMVSACGSSESGGGASTDAGPKDGAAGSSGSGGTAGGAGVGGSAGLAGSGGSAGVGGNAGVAGSGAAPQGCPGWEPIAEPADRLYVAPDGDDNASGEESAPLATLEEAASRFPAGGTVIVRGGVYPQQSWFDAAGEEGNPLYIRAADGETPIFDGTEIQSEWSAVISMASASHVVLEGLEVRSCSAPSCQGISSGEPVLDLTIRGCHIHHMDGPAARFAGRQIRIEGNEFHDLALTNADNVDYPNGGWPTCIGTTPDRSNTSDPWADDIVIRGNVIRDCWGEGIGLWYASNAIVEDNHVENAWNVGIYSDNGFNLRIARNYVHMLRGMNGGQGSGILLGTEEYPSWGIANGRTRNVVVENNVVVAGGGIGWWAMSTPESTYESIQLLHNTVVATNHGALNFSEVEAGVDSPSGCVATNNVFFEASGSWLGDPSAFAFAGNAWLNNPMPSIAGATDVALDVTVGTLSKGTDAQPLAVLVGTGEAGTGVLDDFLCQVRDASAPTRGAFEE